MSRPLDFHQLKRFVSTTSPQNHPYEVSGTNFQFGDIVPMINARNITNAPSQSQNVVPSFYRQSLPSSRHGTSIQNTTNFQMVERCLENAHQFYAPVKDFVNIPSYSRRPQLRVFPSNESQVKTQEKTSARRSFRVYQLLPSFNFARFDNRFHKATVQRHKEGQKRLTPEQYKEVMDEFSRNGIEVEPEPEVGCSEHKKTESYPFSSDCYQCDDYDECDCSSTQRLLKNRAAYNSSVPPLQEFVKKQRKQSISKHCAFCSNNGQCVDVYTSHSLKDEMGRVSCPFLRDFVCPNCYATGDEAHTVHHCPYKKIVGLEGIDNLRME